MRVKLEVSLGDITQTDTKVIVNAANNNFWMGAGVAGAIKDAAGKIVETEAMEKGPVMPGNVVTTSAGKLPFAYIIHAAVMGQDLKTNAKLIRTCTIASLSVADKLKVESIALPAFGTGVGGFPLKACANLMVGTALNYGTQLKNIRRINFCLFDDMAYKIFEETLRTKLSSLI